MCIYLSLSAASGRSDCQGPDAGEDPGEKRPGYGHLRRLKDRPAGVAYHLGPSGGLPTGLDMRNPGGYNHEGCDLNASFRARHAISRPR